MSRCCGHGSGVRGRNPLRQGPGLDIKTANYCQASCLFVLPPGVKCDKSRSHCSPRNLGFIFLFFLVYSPQEETTYFHYALRILHLNGNLWEIVCFESVLWLLCELYSVCKWLYRCEFSLDTSQLDRSCEFNEWVIYSTLMTVYCRLAHSPGQLIFDQGCELYLKKKFFK